MSEAGAPRHDAVVVGSGFGGSAIALRLAEAGRSVLVLERGRRWAPADFPRDPRDAGRIFWRQPARRGTAGLYDVRFLSGLGVIAASGVGGGSLVYAGVHVRPDARVFEDGRWPRSITRESLDPYYERVAETLGAAPLPAGIAVRKRDAYREAARRVGREAFDPDLALSWEADGDGRRPCRLVAECEFGCAHGAKRSVDATYLARAERLGARVETGALASHLEPDGDGYAVVYRELRSGRQRRARGARVVLAAGTLGTNELLLRSRDRARTLPGLTATLGRGFSANGDFLGSLQGSAGDLEPWHGPDVTSVVPYLDAAPEFTMAAPTFNRGTMEVLASLGQPRHRLLRLAGPLVWPRLGRVLRLAFASGLAARPLPIRLRSAGDPARMTNLFAIGRDNAGGVVRLRRGRLDVEWDYARENAALVERQLAAMRELGEAYGARFAPHLPWAAFRRIVSVHPLGGCRLSDSPRDGVIDPDGQVHGHPGLYVADGSAVPTSLGWHPAMTIAALAERTAEAVAGSFRA